MIATNHLDGDMPLADWRRLGTGEQLGDLRQGRFHWLQPAPSGARRRIRALATVYTR
jgi:hypothetical protein